MIDQRHDAFLIPTHKRRGGAVVSPREMRAGDDTYFVKMRCAGCSGERRDAGEDAVRRAALAPLTKKFRS